MAGAETSDANLNVVSVNAQHSSTIVTQTQQAGQVYELDTQPASTPIDAGQTFYSARLPYELCQIIMDCVALPLTDDITSHHRAQLLESVRSLVACTRTCHAWNSYGQRLLFRTVLLDNRPGIYGLSKALYLNPGLAALIDGVVLVSEKVPINTLLPVFAMVFVRRLTALRRLCLVDIKFGLGHRCSISLTSLGLWTLREFTSVTTLTLFHTVFRSPRELARILTSLYNVTTLHCRAVYFASAGQARYFVDHPPLRTTTLALHTGLPLQAVPHPFQAALEEAVSMVTLEDETAEFSCSVDLPRGAISDDPAAACPILRRSGAALRRLTLELMALEAGERVRHNQKLVRYYSLSCNTNLEDCCRL
ncbi:uncharacterized protein C8Q71DRAFT_303756 [Rhodofomes roseus]|uniref:F-box domain-containing protein n=1 Tax=Rhodofomes roseus TaxID=34475 RepID=A0ABQ8K427_9APHY|nr:uncharacterized protein C8Q71DRAFT_303756 [Rhodofomes roseus]KAH9831438.1 hypothetical protein C8Q71DRAFT_303756 [Rhodofomes roseus]